MRLSLTHDGAGLWYRRANISGPLQVTRNGSPSRGRVKALGRPFCHDGTFCPEKYQKLTGSVTTSPSMPCCFISARARVTRDWYSVIMSTLIHRCEPVPVLRIAAMDRVEEELLQLACDRPGLAVADLAV